MFKLSKYKNKRAKFLTGFTLIELLVVISIISLLSSILLASLGAAKQSAKDVAIKNQLRALQTQGALFYSVYSNYTNICSTSVALKGFGNASCPSDSLLCGLAKANPAIPPGGIQLNAGGGWNMVTCNDSPAAWAIEAPSKRAGDNHPWMWCLDSAGNFKLEPIDVVLGGGVICL